MAWWSENSLRKASSGETSPCLEDISKLKNIQDVLVKVKGAKKKENPHSNQTPNHLHLTNTNERNICLVDWPTHFTNTK